MLGFERQRGLECQINTPRGSCRPTERTGNLDDLLDEAGLGLGIALLQVHKVGRVLLERARRKVGARLLCAKLGVALLVGDQFGLLETHAGEQPQARQRTRSRGTRHRGRDGPPW
jgi:hypothetical protein